MNKMIKRCTAAVTAAMMAVITPVTVFATGYANCPYYRVDTSGYTRHPRELGLESNPGELSREEWTERHFDQSRIALNFSLYDVPCEWVQDERGWKARPVGSGEDGWYKDGAHWVDDDGDGIAKKYFFDKEGYMHTNVTDGGSTVFGPDGAMMDIDGVVRLRATASGNALLKQKYADSAYKNYSGLWDQSHDDFSKTAHHNEGYDPAHPLKNVAEQWELFIPSSEYVELFPYATFIYTPNVHARLTGQMEYYKPYTADMASDGNLTYDPDKLNAKEDTIYQWICDWLNSIDFENMTEMERAEQIGYVLGRREWSNQHGDDSYDAYGLIVNHEGVCSAYVELANMLCHVLGLRYGMSGYGNHAYYLMRIDGLIYTGGNDILDLSQPNPLHAESSLSFGFNEQDIPDSTWESVRKK